MERPSFPTGSLPPGRIISIQGETLRECMVDLQSSIRRSVDSNNPVSLLGVEMALTLILGKFPT